MLTVAYLANQFPSAVEPYVADEINALRRRGVQVVAGSARKSTHASSDVNAAPEIVMSTVGIGVLVRAAWLCIRRSACLAPLLLRIVLGGKESLPRRLKALVHTFFGACYAVQLRGRGVQHIHVHHGYFGSWIALTAARLLDVGFSLTLHGSDLLLHGSYLDVKIRACTFCRTVSDYNRRFILAHYPGIGEEKIIVTRMGVEVPEKPSVLRMEAGQSSLRILSVGRLHPVKDHAFLIRACAKLLSEKIEFDCSIAGDGPERARLESLIQSCGLADRVKLLGHVGKEQIGALYDRADVVVLTSRSEGIPLVLMEAMARGKVVLAPAITGISELVISAKTGFLYEAGSLDDFLECLSLIRRLIASEARSLRTGSPPPHSQRLAWIRHAARLHIQHNFDRSRNLERFADTFLERLGRQVEKIPNENLVLQQI